MLSNQCFCLVFNRKRCVFRISSLTVSLLWGFFCVLFLWTLYHGGDLLFISMSFFFFLPLFSFLL